MSAAVATAYESAQVGKPAPDFEIPSTKNIEKLNEPVKLSDYQGKWVVLLFYPLDFTFVCPTELTTFSDRYADLRRGRGNHRHLNGLSVLASCVAANAARQGWRGRF